MNRFLNKYNNVFVRYDDIKEPTTTTKCVYISIMTQLCSINYNIAIRSRVIVRWPLSVCRLAADRTAVALLIIPRGVLRWDLLRIRASRRVNNTPPPSIRFVVSPYREPGCSQHGGSTPPPWRCHAKIVGGRTRAPTPS